MPWANMNRAAYGQYGQPQQQRGFAQRPYQPQQPYPQQQNQQPQYSQQQTRQPQYTQQSQQPQYPPQQPQALQQQPPQAGRANPPQPQAYHDPNVRFEAASPEALRALATGSRPAAPPEAAQAAQAAPTAPPLSPANGIMQNERNAAAFYSLARAKWTGEPVFERLAESSGRRLAELISILPEARADERGVNLPPTAREAVRFAIGEEGASIAELAGLLPSAGDGRARVSIEALLFKKTADMARLIAEAAS